MRPPSEPISRLQPTPAAGVVQNPQHPGRTIPCTPSPAVAAAGSSETMTARLKSRRRFILAARSQGAARDRADTLAEGRCAGATGQPGRHEYGSWAAVRRSPRATNGGGVDGILLQVGVE